MQPFDSDPQLDVHVASVQSTLERVHWSLVSNHISHIESDCVIHLKARQN